MRARLFVFVFILCSCRHQLPASVFDYSFSTREELIAAGFKPWKLLTNTYEKMKGDTEVIYVLNAGRAERKEIKISFKNKSLSHVLDQMNKQQISISLETPSEGIALDSHRNKQYLVSLIGNELILVEHFRLAADSVQAPH